MKTLIKNGIVVNEGLIFKADIIIDNDSISDIVTHPYLDSDSDSGSDEQKDAPHLDASLYSEIIDAGGAYVIPGIIDDQVHFREPGLTRKGDIMEGSRAAAAGGVTSFMDMPNVNPPTVSLQLLEEKQQLAAQKSAVNYSFYLGANSDNLEEIKRVNKLTTCGLKIFMGSSTGNMLVDDVSVLEAIFAESPLLIATHCEDTPTINQNLATYRAKYGDDIPPACHPLIRSREACLKSSSLAARIAHKYNSRLHILHLSTADELPLLDKGDKGARKTKRITGEACIHHLWFNDSAYAERGNFVKWNPAIKTENDRQSLLKAVNDNVIDIIATDHAPHTLEDKNGLYAQVAGGGPMVQHSLIVMLELMKQGAISLETLVDRMAHAPADIFHIKGRGYLRKGYKADICIFKEVPTDEPYIISKNNILYKCGWSPLEGLEFSFKVQTTFVNGKKVYADGTFFDDVRGEMLQFE
ncbi:dihydroorotase [Bacteroidia bacterium]|nr:dihydroorotase [Bacteroidia bacterium]